MTSPTATRVVTGSVHSFDISTGVDGPGTRFAIAAGVPTVERVEVLPFHGLGAAGFAALGLPFPFSGAPPPDAGLLDRVRGQFRGHGLAVS